MNPFFDRKVLSQFDYVLPFFILPLIVISGVLIGEVSELLSSKHLVYSLVGISIFVIVAFIPIRRLSFLVPIAYWLSIFLLILTDLIGVDRGMGAQRWLEIPFIHFTLQPSEFMKPTLILMIAYLIDQKPPPKGGYRLKQFLIFSAYICLPVVLIQLQPDLGTAITLFAMGFGILFLVGVHYKIWLAIAGVIIVFAPILYSSPFIKDYQRKRVVEFLSEKPKYQLQQSLIAIGSGGYNGKKKEEATQAQLKFLPIATSDFIFAYFAERFGFWGAMGLLALYLFLILHILSIGMSDSKDYYLQCVAYGIAMLVFIYTAINIGMVMGLLPVVGLPLPLFSYGGSSFATFMLLFGVLENLLAFKFKFVYNHPPFISSNMGKHHTNT
ncbi:rod shape-determining protein RodA [Helicobacter monodelphidis]|uniref:FtsW/RodA/SpoVE family cell cycle protein n=1 Tax=Helicobacter sp. 15-1451 TaxID=2004995 RepID=UPI000DCD9FC4|nr:FtsW/RodA/SpoVE family cell cycle protein [Helicobacter sp. 15-1451]RAX56575.1 rod shape-determining protein RodA [Helicobacter sp. 15-1451]